VPFGQERTGLLFRAANSEPPPPEWVEKIEAILGLNVAQVIHFEDTKHSLRRRFLISKDDCTQIEGFLISGKDTERSDQNKVRGCASQVWLVTETTDAAQLTFRGDSDAHIVRGLVALVLRLYCRRTAQDILAFDAQKAFDRLGLSGALSSQRSNGLRAMVERIRRDASAVRL
jgi:cysteine desulfuration protein SufE